MYRAAIGNSQRNPNQNQSTMHSTQIPIHALIHRLHKMEESCLIPKQQMHTHIKKKLLGNCNSSSWFLHTHLAVPPNRKLNFINGRDSPVMSCHLSNIIILPIGPHQQRNCFNKGFIGHFATDHIFACPFLIWILGSYNRWALILARAVI